MYASLRPGVRFLRRYVDHYTRGRPTPLSPWFLDWAVTLPRLLSGALREWVLVE